MEAVKTMNPSELVLDPALQPRVGGLDREHIRALQESPQNWPPVVAVEQEGKYLLVDGFHRLQAARNLGLESVRVRIVPAPQEGDLHALAFSLNASHGRPLSLADRRAYAERLLKTRPQLSDREIGRRAGLAGNTVSSIRQQLEESAQIEHTQERVGKGGYTYTPQRQLGELPEAGLGSAVKDLFTKGERKQQRRLAKYLERLAVSLNDQYELEGWRTHQDAVDACRAVLGDERASALAIDLGSPAYNVLQVAIALGYPDPDQEE